MIRFKIFCATLIRFFMLIFLTLFVFPFYLWQGIGAKQNASFKWDLEDCCTYIWHHFSPYLIHFSTCFHVKFRWQRVKFTSFESYSVYNVLCLTFRRNGRVLIESKTLEVISRKNRGSIKSQKTKRSKTKEHTAGHAFPPACAVKRFLGLFKAICLVVFWGRPFAGCLWGLTRLD